MLQDRDKLIRKFRKEVKADRGVRFGIWSLVTIGLLSIINFFLSRLGFGYSLQIGLGGAQLIDVILIELGKKANTSFFLVSFIINIMISSTFILLAVFARKTQAWAFIVSMIIYGLDAIMHAFLGQWPGVTLHLFAEFGILYGYLSLRALEYAHSGELLEFENSEKNKSQKKGEGIKKMLEE